MHLCRQSFTVMCWMQGGAVTPAEAHRAAALQLWAGDVTGALHTVLVADALTADFVNMSVAAGGDAVGSAPECGQVLPAIHYRYVKH